MRKLIFLFAFISTFIFGQTPTGNRVAWTDTVKISYNNQFVDLFELMRDSVHIVRDTTELKAYIGKSQVYLKQLSSSNFYGAGIYVNVDSMYPEPLLAFDAVEQGKQWVRQDLFGKRPYYAIDYGVVPNDSTYSASNTDIINALCLEAYTGSNFLTKTGMVILPAGDIWVEATPSTNYAINIQAGIIVSGMGNSPQKNGTYLRLRAGEVASGDTLIMVMNANAWDYYEDGAYATTGWWHYSGLQNLAINCNGNKQAGKVCGLDIHRAGEASFVENILIGSYKGWGFRTRGGNAPHLRMESISSFPATSADTTADYSYSDRKGFWFDSGGSVNASGLSGDNSRPLVYMGSSGNGTNASVHVDIKHLKYESGNSSHAGSSVSCPVVVDSCNYIGSSLRIRDFAANRGSDNTAAQDYLVLARGVNNTNSNVYIKVEYSQATGYDVLFKKNYGGTADSIVNLSNNYSSVDASQLAGSFESGLAESVVYSNLSPSKAYGSGFYYFNQNGWVRKTLYMSGSDFLVRSPYTGMVIEDSAGVDWFDLNTTNITTGSTRTLITAGQLNIESTWLVKETSTPGTNTAGYAKLALIDDGSNQHLIIRFDNGDIDTLASSTAP